jgi:hypothetical protein
MGTAKSIEWTYEQGTDAELRLTWRDQTTQQPIDLTGYTAVCRISTNPVLVVSPILGGAAGTIVVPLTPAQTLSFGKHRLRFEVDVTEPGGKVVRLVKGKLVGAASVSEGVDG